jgi:hypothetical protein
VRLPLTAVRYAAQKKGDAGADSRGPLSQMRVKQLERRAGSFSSNWWAVLGSNQ